MAESNQTSKPKTPRKTSAAKTGATSDGSSAQLSADSMQASTTQTAPAGGTNHAAEAKGRFNAALQEAKAGAAALRSEAAERAAALRSDASDRASSYRSQARSQSQDWLAEAKTYGDQARGKAGELATDGKGRVAEAIAALGRAVFDTAPTVDERLGAKYGDYARSASRSLQDASTRLDAKSVEELGEDARQFVRQSPGLAVGLAAVGGFMLARLFRSSND